MEAPNTPKAKPRILFVSTAKTIGGGEVYLTSLLEGLKEKYDCTVLGRPPLLNLVKKDAATLQITLFPPWIEKFLRRSFRIKKLYYKIYFRRFFKKQHYDIVNLQEFDGAFVEAIKFRPMILTEQTRLFIPDNMQFWAAGLLTKFDKIICVSKQTLDDIEALSVPREKCVVIHNGVDTSRFKPFPKTGRFITWVGRLEEEDKNPMLFVEIAEAAQSKGLEYKFRMVGDGSMMERIQNYARSHRLNNLEIAGPRNNREMQDIYRQAKLLCMTSKTEGLPFAALEAMACGRPVVASDVGGLREIINSADIGRLIVGFDENEFLEAISTIADNPKLYERMSRTARKRVEDDFSVSKMTEQTIKQYEEILGARYD